MICGLFSNYFLEQFSIFYRIKKIRKQRLMIKKIVFYFFLGLFPKLIMQIYRMIKNKALGMKIIFKIYLNY